MHLRVLAVFSIFLTLPVGGLTQAAPRRPTTIALLNEYPTYYHLQNVLVHGEFVESGSSIVLRGGDRDIPVLLNGQRATTGLVEVRGQLIDVGRLEPTDPRLSAYEGRRSPDEWPRPGEELLLSVTGVTDTPLAMSPSVRSVALQPWRFDGQKVEVVGQFRGRNLFGDLPSAPGQSRYDFVLRFAGAAVWVTNLRPRGKGFDLSVDARVDTGQWLQVSGIVSVQRGLATIAGATVSSAQPPDTQPDEEEAPAPPPPLEPAELIFSSPTEGDLNVPPDGTVRLQFSRGLDPNSLDGLIHVSYLGSTGPGGQTGPEFAHAYDLGTRSVTITFRTPLDRFRTVKVELLEGIKAFDGAPVVPATVTFSTGG